MPKFSLRKINKIMGKTSIGGHSGHHGQQNVCNLMFSCSYMEHIAQVAVSDKVRVRGYVYYLVLEVRINVFLQLLQCLDKKVFLHISVYVHSYINNCFVDL